MSGQFWEEELSSFPHAGLGRGSGLWVARREGESSRETLRLLFARAPAWAPPLGRIWRVVESGCPSEGPWRPRPGGAETPVAAAAASGRRPTLWVEPLRQADAVMGALALAYDGAPPWGEAVRLWGERLAARVGPLLDRLPAGPPPATADAQPTLFALPTSWSGSRAAPSVGPRGLRLPRPVFVPGVPGAVGVSAEFTAACAQARAVAATGVSVILHGESGTGKEILARAIHLGSPREGQPFIGVNCAAMPETLFESELFGHRAGAFTGAASDKVGLLEAASGGTFFLDEIGDMPLALQIKLLRVMQERRLRRLGELDSRAVDLRWIAATHKDLPAEVAAGRFRLDLYYRLKVVHIAIPPLRSRPEDVPHLLAWFLQRHGGDPQRRRLQEETLAVLQAWRWPGNARELENEALRLLALHRDEPLLRPEHLSPEIRHPGRPAVAAAELGTLRPLEEAGALLEQYLIRKAVEACAGRKAAAARRLGLSRQGLYKKIRRHGLLDLLGPGAEPAEGGTDADEPDGQREAPG